jgi:LCP family protein required for cell wall assembly
MTPPDPPYPYDSVPPPATPRRGTPLPLSAPDSATSGETLTRAQLRAARAGSKPPTSAATRTKKRPSRRRIWARRGLVLGLVLVVVVAGAGIFLYYWIGRPNHVTVYYTQNEIIKGQENILLVGSTIRCGLTNNPLWNQECNDGVTGINSDIVMIAHLNLTKGTASLLSIPRDLFVPNARTGGANKIDAGLVDGPSQLVRSVEEDFGIPINHYVVLNFQTFSDVVNDLGGVYMYFPDGVYDADSGLNIKKPGCYFLNGNEALEVVRARHLQYQTKSELKAKNEVHQDWPQEALSDIARIERTHEFLKVLAKQEQSVGLGNVDTDAHLLKDVISNLTVDQNLSTSDMLHLAYDYSGADVLTAPQYTYPIVTVGSGNCNLGYVYEGICGYGDVEFPVQPGGYLAINKLFNVAPGGSSFTGLPLPSAGSFKLSVVDGSNNASLTSLIARRLSGRGYDVTGTGSTTPVNSAENETVVYYGGPPPPKKANWKSPDLADAQSVMENLEGPVIMAYDPSMVGSGDKVTLDIGNDVTIAPKNITTPPTTTSTSTTTTLSTTSTTNGHTVTSSTVIVTPTTVADPPGIRKDPGVSSPTALSATLAWYDPLSCNAAHNGPGSY